MSLRNIFNESKKYSLMGADHWSTMVSPSNIEIHLNNGSNVAITLTTQNTMYSFTPSGVQWSNDLSLSGFSYNINTGIITSTTTVPVRCFFAINVCYTTNDVVTNSLKFQLYKNGTALVGHTVLTWVDGNSYPNNCCLTGMDDVNFNDTYELKVSCTTNASSTVIPTFLNYSIYSI